MFYYEIGNYVETVVDTGTREDGNYEIDQDRMTMKQKQKQILRDSISLEQKQKKIWLQTAGMRTFEHTLLFSI